MPNVALTNITPPRVPLLDARTGLISREWYRFFLNLFDLTGGGQNTTSITDLQVGPPAVPQEDLTQINIDIAGLASQPTEESANEQIAELYKAVQGVLSQPDQAATIEQIAEISKALQGLALQPRPELGTMSQLQQAWFPWMTFDNAPEVTPPDVGTVAWDGGTTLGVQMTANVLGRVNESGYYYIKASSAITKGDVVMFTGAVGASGVPTGAPATGVTDGTYIMGIAAESMALNAFGLVQFQGTLRGVNLSAYADGDILWYNPAVTGGLTKTKPTAPNVKVQMAAVISASNNGTMLIRVNAGSVLGGTDSNVNFGTLSNGDLIQYDSALQYWKNVPSSTFGTGSVTSVSVVSANGFAGSVATATTTPAITLSTSITGLLYGNGTALAAATVSAPLTYSAGTLAITQSTSSTNGYLSSTDWSTFNAKQSVAAPVTKTADFTVAATDLWLINNKSGSTCTVTLPAASSNTGRVLHFLNYQAYTVVSASSNVVPLTGGAAGTAILAAVAGDTATLVSDGTNWIMTQYTPNNVLLLE